MTTQSRNHPPRASTQRVAVVAREGLGSQAGVWAEVKTVEADGSARIERGYFTPPTGDEEARLLPSGALLLEIRRFQAMNRDGKLYEYELGASEVQRLGSEGAALSLFEINAGAPLTREDAGPDTLYGAGRALPARVERVLRVGGEEWEAPGDSLTVFRAVVTQTLWRADRVPVTGFVRSIYEVTTERFGPRDSTGARPLLRRAEGSPAPPPLFRAEMQIVDFGDDAVPEVTQEAEPAPAEALDTERPGIPSR